MNFKLLKKQWGTGSLGNDQVSIRKTAISFGDNFVDFLKQNSFVEIYLDEVEKKVGFKSSSDINNAYKVQWDKTSGKRPAITSQKIAKLFPNGKYDAKIDDGFIVISVEKIHDKNNPKE